MNVDKKLFGYASGEEISLYTLTLDDGANVSITDFGGAIVSLKMPDRRGRLADVVGGYDDLSDYVEGNGYQGALIGRFGNRIANGRFTLDGKEYTLYTNSGKNHLHGGKTGFSHKRWDAVPSIESDGCALTLSYTSPDGEEGYPGELRVTVKYKLTSDHALEIAYSAQTDKKTVLNLTNHTYFNLGGYASGKIFDHVIEFDCDSFLETDKELIPTGRIIPVEGTPFDFRTPATIGEKFDLSYEPLRIAGGFDHCMCFTKSDNPMSSPRIRVLDPKSGRGMEVYTDMPCVQFYTANFLNNPDRPHKGGYPQAIQNAFCLETQKMPDSVNRKEFTDCTLDEGETFTSKTVYRFFCEQ